MSTEAISAPAAATEAKPPVSTPPEAPEAGKTAETKTEPKESVRFAALARKEKAFQESQRQHRAELERERQAIKAEREATAAKIAEFEAWQAKREQLKGSPVKAVKELLGLDYDVIANDVLKGGAKADPAEIAQREIQKFKAEQEEARKTQLRAEAEAKEADAKKQVDAFHAEIVTWAKAKADTYEFIAAEDAWDEIPAVIEEHYRQTQAILTQEEAAQMVENFLEEKALKLAATKKFKAKAQPQPTQEAPKRNHPAPQVRPTISNGMTASQASVKSTREERRRKASAAIDAARAQAKSQ